ncbi:PLAC8-like protein 1 isoform X2 [Hypomesus transpacificus]|uniref:PLAC8-like protein 1 isoform X2 n=1 Tax=Hypomesus transpacificus TaxID=137520 RepID=UPI001F076C0B|nr:PLAC8-like protein 1 isoform X2 [Hypomesus transpacificus]
MLSQLSNRCSHILSSETMATSVIINNQPPQPPPQAIIAVQTNQWSTGICGCFDDLQVCCFAYWCFPCFACTTASEFGECFCLPLLDVGCGGMQMLGLPSCTPPVSMSMRVAVRNRYGIQGDMTDDCVYATFCNVCSWCQMAREIKRRSQPFTLINAQPTVLAQTQAQAQAMMVAASPLTGVISSQPHISPASPQTLMTARFM